MIERLSTHVLDTATGRPARGVPAVLHDGAGAEIGRGTTDDDGRVARLNGATLPPGDYALTLELGDRFHPRITVHVRLDGSREHYHLPVLASPFSYTTYLGS